MNIYLLPQELICKIVDFLTNINEIYIIYCMRPDINFIFNREKNLLINNINSNIANIFGGYDKLNLYNFLYCKEYYRFDDYINIPLYDLKSNIMIGLDHNFRKFIILKVKFDNKYNIIILYQKYIFNKDIWFINTTNKQMIFPRNITTRTLLNSDTVEKIKYILSNNFNYNIIQNKFTMV